MMLSERWSPLFGNMFYLRRMHTEMLSMTGPVATSEGAYLKSFRAFLAS